MISFSHTPHKKPKCSSHTLVERRLLFSDVLVVVLSLWQVFLLSSRAGWEMGAVLGLYPNEDAHSRLWWPRLTHKCTHLQNHDYRVCEVGWGDERIDGYSSPKKPLLLNSKCLLCFIGLGKEMQKRGREMLFICLIKLYYEKKKAGFDH